MERPIVAADLLMRAIRGRTHKITMALIHPQDMAKVDMVLLRVGLSCEILPSADVERGMLYLSIKPLR